MWVGWRRLSTESAGIGEKWRRLTGLVLIHVKTIPRKATATAETSVENIKDCILIKFLPVLTIFFHFDGSEAIAITYCM